MHGGRFWHCQVTCLLPLHVHSWIPSSVKLDAGTRQRQRLISTFWGRAAAGSAVEPVGAGERRCALVRACAPPISFGRDGWFGCSVQGAWSGARRVVAAELIRRKRCGAGPRARGPSRADACPAFDRAGGTSSPCLGGTGCLLRPEGVPLRAIPRDSDEQAASCSSSAVQRTHEPEPTNLFGPYMRGRGSCP